MYKLQVVLYRVISSVGPEKLVPGRKIPAAPMLVVSSLKLSASTLIRAFGNSFFSSIADVIPTTPQPKTATSKFDIVICNEEFIKVGTEFICYLIVR